MTRADQRQVLEALSRDHVRELHDLLGADLQRAFARRIAATVPPWLHAVTPLRESEGS